MENILNEVINTYVSVTYGYVYDKNLINKIKRIAYYLYDNNYDNKSILKYLLKHGEILDTSLWENSLLKPNTFYYHNKLTIMPGPSIWHPNMKEKANKFYLEMKIKFDIDDLLNYYYKELIIPVELRNYNKDKKAFEYLLNFYTKFKVQAIDFILFLIDYNKSEKASISNVFDLQKYEKETFDKINYIIENNIHKSIVWRY